MKAILMSIQSKHLVNILNGKKTIELRKKFPSDYRGWVYAYCTLGRPYLYECALYSLAKKGECAFVHNDKDETALNFLSGKVVCRFWVYNVEEIDTNLGHPSIYVKACVQDQEAIEYGKGKIIKAIHISKLEILDKPKELGEFYYKRRWITHSIGYSPYVVKVKTQVRKAPQSWQYVEVEE